VILTGPEIARLVAVSKRYTGGSGETSKVLYGERNPADDLYDPDDYVDIEPFEPAHCGPNSYDLTLAPGLLVYDLAARKVLDSRRPNPTKRLRIGKGGGVLKPGVLYLGSTAEATACAGYAPMLETRFSLARLGVSCHLSAGFGDDGFCGRWTLEITVAHPVKLFPGVRVAQVAFFKVLGRRMPYAGKYQFQGGTTASKAHEDRR
jgi:deoxycytidine triphosphate deaminase